MGGLPASTAGSPLKKLAAPWAPLLSRPLKKKGAFSQLQAKLEKYLWPHLIAASQEKNPSEARWLTGSYDEEHTGRSNAKHDCLLMTDDACARLLDQHLSRNGGAASKDETAASPTRGAGDNSAAHPVQQVAGVGGAEDLQVVPVCQGELPEEGAAWDEQNPESRASSNSRNIATRPE
jgi:hypothetical protein